MHEIRWRELADRQYKKLCATHRRLPSGVEGVLLTIDAAGLKQQTVTATQGKLFYANTVKGKDAPSCAVYYTWDAKEGVYWVEEVHPLPHTP